jgi:hypothetical protein
VLRNGENIKEEKNARSKAISCKYSGHVKRSLGCKAGEEIGASSVAVLDNQDGFSELGSHGRKTVSKMFTSLKPGNILCYIAKVN